MDKLSNWREKAKKRSKEISALKKRKEELVQSRDNWKSKYKEEKAKNAELHKEVKRETKSKVGNKVNSPRPKHHSYSAQIIMLCVWMRQQGNCSLRSCAGVLKVMSLILQLEIKTPNRNTIQNWEKKVGYNRIKTGGTHSGEMVIILDESISIGQQKLLLILGIDLREYSWEGAPGFKDVKVLFIGIGKSWTGASISQELEALKSKGIKIIYGVSDGGSNLCKAFIISDILQVQDCTHAIGNVLKKIYKTDETFLAFSKECGKLRKQLMLSEHAALMPPKQRVKGRFLNLQPVSKWAHDMLLVMDRKGGLSDEQRSKLKMLLDYRTLIKQMYNHCQTMDKLFETLKNKGLDAQTYLTCKTILSQSDTLAFFQTEVQKYLDRNLHIVTSYKPLICCSDIIESCFGKYKNQLAKMGNQLITDSCLGIANFCKNFSEQEIIEAMEAVKIVDLKKWREKNLSSSIIQERKKILKNTG